MPSRVYSPPTGSKEAARSSRYTVYRKRKDGERKREDKQGWRGVRTEERRETLFTNFPPQRFIVFDQLSRRAPIMFLNPSRLIPFVFFHVVSSSYSRSWRFFTVFPRYFRSPCTFLLRQWTLYLDSYSLHCVHPQAPSRSTVNRIFYGN